MHEWRHFISSVCGQMQFLIVALLLLSASVEAKTYSTIKISAILSDGEEKNFTFSPSPENKSKPLSIKTHLDCSILAKFKDERLNGAGVMCFNKNKKKNEAIVFNIPCGSFGTINIADNYSIKPEEHKSKAHQIQSANRNTKRP